MTDKKRPRKPVPPLGHIVFPKAGPVRKVVEPLSDMQEDLETAVVQKFVGALKYFEGRTLTGLKKSDPWPDFTAREGTTNWAIELTELLEPKHAALYQLQQSYRAAIVDRLGGIPKFLDGIDVLIDDNYQQPPFPAAHTPQGDKIVSTIVNELNILSDDLAKLSVERILIRDMVGKQDAVPRLRLSCFRFASANRPGRIHFSGTFPIAIDDVRHLLQRTILSKLEKHYQSWEGHRFLLLIYELRMISVETGGVALAYAQNVLRSHDHPFNEVWYLYPYAEQDLGHLVRVWPILEN